MKRSLPLIAIAAGAAALLTLSGCANSAGADLVGVWGHPDTSNSENEPSLEFTADGDYGGTDGCNSVGGSWSRDGDAIDLGMMRSTLMYCEGVDDWLTQARTAELRSGTPATLVFFDENGAEIGTLERAE